jgi:hypothetical protein
LETSLGADTLLQKHLQERKQLEEKYASGTAFSKNNREATSRSETQESPAEKIAKVKQELYTALGI